MKGSLFLFRTLFRARQLEELILLIMLYSLKRGYSSTFEFLLVLQYLLESLSPAFQGHRFGFRDESLAMGQFLLSFLCNFSRIVSCHSAKGKASIAEHVSEFPNDPFSKKQLKSLIFLSVNNRNLDPFVFFLSPTQQSKFSRNSFLDLALVFIEKVSRNKLFSEKINELFIEHLVYAETGQQESQSLTPDVEGPKEFFLNSFGEFLKNVWKLVPGAKTDKSARVKAVRLLRHNICTSFAVELFVTLKSLPFFSLSTSSKSSQCALLLQVINDKLLKAPVSQILKRCCQQLIHSFLDELPKLLLKQRSLSDCAAMSADDLVFQRFVIFLNKCYSKMATLVRGAIDSSRGGMDAFVRCCLDWNNHVAKLSGLFFLSKLSLKGHEDVLFNINSIFKSVLQIVGGLTLTMLGDNPRLDPNGKGLKRLKGSQQVTMASFVRAKSSEWNLEISALKQKRPVREEAVRVSLGVLSNLFRGVSELSEPFVAPSLALSSLLVEEYVRSKPIDQKQGLSQKLRRITDSLIESISSGIDFRLSLKHALILIDSSREFFSFEVFSNATHLVNNIIQKLDADLFAEKKEILHKTIVNGLENLNSFLVNERLKRASACDDLTTALDRFYKTVQESQQRTESSTVAARFKTLWIEAYSGFALKCNEKELKGFFIALREWAETDLLGGGSTDQASRLRSKLYLVQKKQILVEVLNKIISQISFMGISLYEEVLQMYMDFQGAVIQISKLITIRPADVPEKLFEILEPKGSEMEAVGVQSDRSLLEEDLSDFEQEPDDQNPNEPPQSENLIGKRRTNLVQSNSKKSPIWFAFVVQNFEYETLILESLKLLFDHDQDSFMDAIKFETISTQLMLVVSEFRVSRERPNNLGFFEMCVFPVISSLLKLVGGRASQPACSPRCECF